MKQHRIFLHQERTSISRKIKLSWLFKVTLWIEIDSTWTSPNHDSMRFGGVWVSHREDWLSQLAVAAEEEA